mgnify:CR=1 FL=1
MFGFLSVVKERERAGKKVIHFEIGDPHFDTPPAVVAAAKKSLDAGETHYTSSSGLWELREEIARYAKDEWGFLPDISQVVVSPANALIDFVIRTIANPGDEVLYPDPGFPTYAAVCAYAGVRGVPVPLREKDSFRMSPEETRKRITPRTRLIILNSPQNPTGSVLTKDDVEAFYRLAEENDCCILSDEVYRKLSDAQIASASSFDRCSERVILLYSFSKAYAMSGWRLGFVVAPPIVAQKIGLMAETILSCLPVFIQRGGIAALSSGEKGVAMRWRELQKRRSALIQGLNTIPGVSCVSPGGAFYAFANISGTGLSSVAFRDLMLEKAGVSLLDGTAVGAQGDGFVRMSFASATVPMIKKAIAQMIAVLKNSPNR